MITPQSLLIFAGNLMIELYILLELMVLQLNGNREILKQKLKIGKERNGLNPIADIRQLSIKNRLVQFLLQELNHPNLL